MALFKMIQQGGMRVIRDGGLIENRVQNEAAPTSVTTEYLLVHNGSDGQTVETIGKRLPQFDIVATFAWKNSIHIKFEMEIQSIQNQKKFNPFEIW